MRMCFCFNQDVSGGVSDLSVACKAILGCAQKLKQHVGMGLGVLISQTNIFAPKKKTKEEQTIIIKRNKMRIFKINK